MIDRIIGSHVAELIFYIVLWGILLPLSLVLATPIILIHALLHLTTCFETLAHDYRGLWRWWLGHYPFQGTPRVPAQSNDVRFAGGNEEEGGDKS